MFNENPSLPPKHAAAAMTFGATVKLSSDTYALAGAADIGVGVLTRNVNADEVVQPRRPSAGGQVMIAAGAINPGDQVVAAANGKVQTLPTAAGTYVRRGIAFGAAAADGDLIEVEPQRWGETVTVSG